MKKLAFFFEVPVKDFEEAIQEALDISIIQKVDKAVAKQKVQRMNIWPVHHTIVQFILDLSSDVNAFW